MARRTFKVMLLAGMLLLAASASLAEVVVVANARSGIDRLTRDEVVNIFLGRYRQLSSGLPAIPVDLPASDAGKASFYRLLVGKDLSDLNAYWARLVFSGRTAPPRQSNGEDDLLRFVAENPGAVGYLERSRVDSRVRIVFDFGS
ncbi:hypothetical protein [Rhodocyclus purpureus]|uniref:hypothetical protein n=1 Tax=Rhodocyclus purpureus TaxID=1067 RepID=UPI001912DFBE|nr:hypothetical protein [Rhodocyclus purpureus]MBK5915114.1 hypothetical protein [Rhodocyclus purpureus]